MFAWMLTASACTRGLVAPAAPVDDARAAALTRVYLAGGGRPAVEDAFGCDWLAREAIRGHTQAVRLLLEHTPNIRRQWISPLHHALLSPAPDDLALLVLTHTEDVDAPQHPLGTPLHTATIRHRLAVVAELIRRGANVQSTDEFGCTPLHKAAQHGHVAIAACLLAAGASPSATNRFGRTPLHDLAAHTTGGTPQSRTELGQALLRAGAPVAASDALGNTPLHYAAGTGLAHLAADLVRAGTPHDARNGAGLTPADHALRNGHVALAQALAAGDLSRWVAGPTAGTCPPPVETTATASGPRNRQTSSAVARVRRAGAEDGGETALHRALREGPGAMEAVRAHVRSGASLNTPNVFGATPLHYAAARAWPEAVELLLSAGASTAAADAQGQSPLHVVGAGLPVRARARAETSRVAEMLITAGAERDARDRDQCTPLLTAALRGDAPLVRVLLARGADATATDHGGSSAVLLAAEAGNVDVVRALVAAGADVNRGNCWQVTPLMAAVRTRTPAIVKLLLELGAKVDARTEFGDTPLHGAVWANDLEIAQMLLRAGADPAARNKGGRTPRDDAHDPRMRELLENWRTRPGEP